MGHAGSVLGSVSEPDPVLDLIPNPGSDLVLDMGFSSASGSDLSDPLPAASSPRLSVLGNPLGNDGFLSHLELGAMTAMLREKASNVTTKSPEHTGIKPVHAGDPLSIGVLVAEAEEVSVPSPQTLSSNTIVDFV